MKEGDAMMVKIMQGLPGSGKTTRAKRWAGESGYILSADRFFEQKDGSWKFDPTKLSQAHNWCLNQYTERVVLGFFPRLVVDNTNCTVAEIAPYYQLALSQGHDVWIERVLCDVELAYSRNTHGVHLDIIAAMDRRMWEQTAFYPPWWRVEEIAWSEE